MQVRKRLGAIIALLGLFVMMLPLVVAAANGDVCPEDGKVESEVDGDLDNIVLDEGTEVCIFGGNVQVNVTADGESTLKELLDVLNPAGEALVSVSHYTVAPPTTEPPTEPPVTEPPVTQPPVTQPPVTTPEELPFTGIDTGLMLAGALALLASGGLMVRKNREQSI